MFSAIDGSTRLFARASLSMDLLIVQPSNDRQSIDRLRKHGSYCAFDGWSCTIDHPWQSINACTLGDVDD